MKGRLDNRYSDVDDVVKHQMPVLSKPQTFGKERNNKGSSTREQEGKQHWVKSDRLSTNSFGGERNRNKFQTKSLSFLTEVFNNQFLVFLLIVIHTRIRIFSSSCPDSVEQTSGLCV